MQIKELGEFKFIERVRKKFTGNLPEDVLHGIGDDCAVIKRENDYQIITTDMLIENTHFLKKSISSEDLGFKSLAVNLSDIAAMGGNPQYAFLSLGIPKNIKIAWLDNFYHGLHTLADETNVHLLGGDTVGSDNIVINICLVGSTKNLTLRKKATIGDIVCTTGMLGDSGAGCKLILDDKKIDDEDMQYLINSHNRPPIFIKEGEWLANKVGVHAMMDLSDGLSSDLERLQEAANVDFDIDPNKLPLSNALTNIATKFNWNPVELAVSGGEDYCLLLTIDPKEYPSIKKDYEQTFKTPLYEIGKVASKNKNSYNAFSNKWKSFNHWK